MEIHGFDIIAILFIHFVGGMITLNAVNNALDNYEDITVEGMKSVTAIKFIQNNIGQQWGDDTTLRCSLCWMFCVSVWHENRCFENPANHKEQFLIPDI